MIYTDADLVRIALLVIVIRNRSDGGAVDQYDRDDTRLTPIARAALVILRNHLIATCDDTQANIARINAILTA
jgi:hypothetical protein